MKGPPWASACWPCLPADYAIAAAGRWISVPVDQTQCEPCVQSWMDQIFQSFSFSFQTWCKDLGKANRKEAAVYMLPAEDHREIINSSRVNLFSSFSIYQLQKMKVGFSGCVVNFIQCYGCFCSFLELAVWIIVPCPLILNLAMWPALTIGLWMEEDSVAVQDALCVFTFHLVLLPLGMKISQVDAATSALVLEGELQEADTNPTSSWSQVQLSHSWPMRKK